MNMAREQWVGRFEVAENDYPIVFNFFSIYITCFSIFITKQMNGHFRKQKSSCKRLSILVRQ